MSYKITGQYPNIQLVRMDEKGKALSARPASKEELDMHNELRILRDEREEYGHRTARLRVLLGGALLYAPELAELPHADRSEALTIQLADDLRLMGEEASNG